MGRDDKHLQIQTYVILNRQGRVVAVKLNRKSAAAKCKAVPGSRMEPHLADKLEEGPATE